MIVGLAAATCIRAAIVQPGVRAAWSARGVPLAVLVGLFLIVAFILTRTVGGRRDRDARARHLDVAVGATGRRSMIDSRLVSQDENQKRNIDAPYDAKLLEMARRTPILLRPPRPNRHLCRHAMDRRTQVRSL
jgi:hypothetical protein